jgi:hypothetical protein
MSNIYVDYQVEDESYIYEERDGKLVLVARFCVDRIEKYNMSSLRKRKQALLEHNQDFLASVCDGIMKHVDSVTKDNPHVHEPLPKDYHAIKLLLDSDDDYIDYFHFGVDVPARVGGVYYPGSVEFPDHNKKLLETIIDKVSTGDIYISAINSYTDVKIIDVKLDIAGNIKIITEVI